MRYRRLAITALLLGLSGSAFGGSPLYLTTSRYFQSNDSYVFIAPYFAQVRTMVSVSISKAAGGAGGSNPTAKAGPPGPPPDISSANGGGPNGLTTFNVSCDLTSVVVAKKSVIFISGVIPANTNSGGFDGLYKVTDVTSSPNTVVGQPQSGQQATGSGSGGTIESANCPSSSNSTSGNLTVSVGVNPIPSSSRAYLYLRRDAFYNDAINVGVGTDGMLSSSDTSSQQQITTILTELAQTAEGFVFSPFTISNVPGKPPPSPAPTKEFRSECFGSINDLVKAGPYYSEFELSTTPPKRLKPKGTIWQFTVNPPSSDETIASVPYDEAKRDWDYSIKPARAGLEIDLHVKPFMSSPGYQTPLGVYNWGLVVFFPVPAQVAILCRANEKFSDAQPGDFLFLSSPLILNLYTESRLLAPQRDFLTGPQDTFTFSSGFIIGHKYSDQSAAKTIVDTVTSPIRAMMPSNSTTQSVTVQSTGASSKTTSTTTSPPKGP